MHILQGHIGGVALFGVNGDGVGGGLGLAGGLVFGGQGDVFGGVGLYSRPGESFAYTAAFGAIPEGFYL